MTRKDKYLVHFEHLEPRILLSGDSLFNILPDPHQQDTFLDDIPQVVQYAELLDTNEQVEEQISLEPAPPDTTNTNVCQPIFTLTIDDNKIDEQSVDADLSVDNIGYTQTGEIALLSYDSNGKTESNIGTTEDENMPTYINDADLSKEYATSIEIRGPPTGTAEYSTTYYLNTYSTSGENTPTPNIGSTYQLIAPDLPSLQLVDSDINSWDGQIVYLDFDGEENITYNGPVIIGPFDIPEFQIPGVLAGQEQEFINQVIAELERTYAGTGIIFTTLQPTQGSEYSTIYIGGDDSPFSEYGSFLGLAETVDVGNKNRADDGFVFSSEMTWISSDASQLIETITHEVGHLLGYSHFLWQPLSNELSEFAAITTQPISLSATNEPIWAGGFSFDESVTFWDWQGGPWLDPIFSYGITDISTSLSARAHASTGTVSVDFDGSLSISYPDSVQPGQNIPLTISAGLSSGTMDGLLGAGLDIPLDFHLGYQLPWPLLDGALDYNVNLEDFLGILGLPVPQDIWLNTSANISPQFGTTNTARGFGTILDDVEVDLISLAAYIAPVVIPIDLVLNANLGFDLQLVRDDNFRPNSLQGNIDLNGSQVGSFSLMGGSSTIYVDIPLNATNSISLDIEDLLLANTFNTTFSLGFNPYFQAEIDILGVVSVELYRYDFPSFSFPLLELDPRTLNFTITDTPAITIPVVQPEPEISIEGKGYNISDGDTTPSTTDGTNFGSVNVSSDSVTGTFTVSNTGMTALNLTGSPRVSLTGSSDFSVVSQPSTLVSAGGSTTFQIRFDPSSEGAKTAAVSIANNDSNENPYDFVIQGTGTDMIAPTADLSHPAPGASILDSVINGSERYIDVTFTDTGGNGLNLSTITDSGQEFTLGGTAASGVAVDGLPTLQSGTTYRYSFAGDFGTGPVNVNFIAGSWADNAGNANVAEIESFLVRSPILYVDDDAPGDPGPGDPSVPDPLEDGTQAHPFDSIQEAIDIAYEGDTIIVLDGIYTGVGNRDIDFNGKAITVTSENGPETCIIDCQGTQADPHRGFYFHSGESIDSIVEGLTIRNGYAQYGGGISCYPSSNPTIKNCTFSSNSAFAYGGGIYAYSDSNIEVIGCSFSENTAHYGAGVHISYSLALLRDCIFVDNIATGKGGGLSSAYSTPTVGYCIFSGNSADEGGGISIFGSDPTLINCVFNANTANYGGAISNDSHNPPYNNSNPTLTNCTFVANSSPYGRALACDSSNQQNPGSIQITNSIFWDGSSEIWNNDGSTVVVTYSSVQDEDPDDGIVYPGIGNIDDDPLFIRNPDDGGDGWGVGGNDDFGDLRLSANSPCIDAGDNTAVLQDVCDIDGDGNTTERTPLDLDGRNRFIDSPIKADTGLTDLPDYPYIVDMGAYEYQGPRSFYVDDDAPGDPGPGDPSVPDPLEDGTQAHPFDSIQEAIDIAIDGDIVTVAEGTYYENINIDSKGIVLTSADPDNPTVVNSTVIDGGGSGSVVLIDGVTSGVTLTGLTITGGSWPRGPGGGICIICSSAPVNINKCNITGNTALQGGGILIDYSASLSLNKCNIIGNTAHNGGGIYLGSANENVTISECLFSDNEAASGGAISGNFSNAVIQNCVFAYNSTTAWPAIGGALQFWGGPPQITSCTFVENSADRGGAIALGYSDTQLSNCIFWQNTASQGQQILLYSEYDLPATLLINYCNVQAGQSGVYADPATTLNWGEGNIDDAPCFADPNYHLLSNSPCIDAGDPSSDYSLEPQPNGGRVNMGAYGNTPSAAISMYNPAYGWGLPGYDEQHSHFFPFASQVNVGNAPFSSHWTADGENKAYTGDVDGDGILELVTGDGSNVHIFDASGSLVSTISGVGGLNIVDDVTGDSRPEILVSDRIGTILRIRAFDASGAVLKTYTKTVSNTDTGITAYAVTDLDKDGDLELVATISSGYSIDKRGVVIFDATSGSEVGYLDVGPTPWLLSIGDVTGDNELEILYGNGSPSNGRTGADGSNDWSSYVWCLNPTAATIWRRGPFNSGGFYDSTAMLADLDGDGTLDIIAAASSHGWSEWDGTVGRVMLLNPADGTTRAGYDRDFGRPVEISAVADLNADGQKEILVVHKDGTAQKYYIRALNSTAGLTDWKVFEAGGSGTNPTIRAVNDVNGDGSLEVIVTAGNKLYVLNNDLTVKWEWSRPDNSALRVNDAIVSDLDGDGINEIIVASGDSVDNRRVDVLAVDYDGDGIPSVEEQGPDGTDLNFDGNDDGIPDSQQDNAASFYTVTDDYVTIACPDAVVLNNVKAVDNPSPADVPAGVEMPYGFFEFVILDVGVGGATTVDIHVPDGSLVNSYYKYGPTPNNPTDHWYEFLYDGQTGAQINGNVITLHFVDGLRGDNDITANGTVVEPGGPAIVNVVPTVDAGPDQTVNEGQTVNVTATFSDPNPSDTHTAEIDWGDGTVEPGVVDELAGVVTGSHIYADDDIYTVTVTVTDNNGAFGNDSLAVTVNDVGPIAALVGDTVLDEGQSGSFDASGSTSSPDAIVSYEWDWDYDGVTFVASGDTGATQSHTWLDDGTYTVVVRVTDDDGSTDIATLAVTVNNVAPTVNDGSDQAVNEGDTVNLDPATFNDLGTLDTHTATIDWGDGTGPEPGIVTESPFGPPGSTSGADGTIDGSHVYADNGTYIVTVTVTDDDGGVGSDMLTVTVNNVAPTVDAGPDQTVDEGQLVNLLATFNDKGTLDTHTATIDWGDGTALDTGVVTETTFGPPGSTSGANGTISGSHVYADNGTYTVVVMVTDDDGGTTSDTLTVTVNNIAPTVDAGSDQTANEGDVVNFSGSFTDPGSADTHTIEWDFGDASVASSTLTPSHVYADNGIYTVTLTVTDDDGGVGVDTLTVTVNNVAPAVDVGPDQTVDEGDVVNFSGSFTDPGSADTHTIEWDFGDASTTSGTLTPSHVYADNGVYTVKLTVTDDDGASTSDTLAVTVNNIAPVVDAGSDQVVDEGDLVILLATFNDKGTLDTHTTGINWGDGTPVETGIISETPFGPPGSTSGTDGTISGSHVYADNGIYTVTVTVTDDDLGSTSDSLKVTVNNVAPDLASLADQLAVVEGQFITLGPVTFSDPGFDNPLNTGGETEESFTAMIDWGDGTTEPVGDITLIETDGSPGVPTTGTIDTTHVYADNGTYTVTVMVFDDDGGSDSETFQITVANVEPTLTVVGNQTVNEGQLLSITELGTFTDPGFDNPLNVGGELSETFTCSIDWGDGTAPDTGIPDWISGSEGVLTAGSFDDSHVYADDGVYTVTVIVDDDDGGSDTKTFLVTVNNVGPAVTADVSMQDVQYSDLIDDVTFTATDVPADTMNATVSYSADGGITFIPGLPDAGTVDGGLSLFGDSDQTGTGVWTLTGIADLAPGTYIIRVIVNDEDGGSNHSDTVIEVQKEDAFVTYNGPGFVSTPSVRDSVAIVELRAVIQDITAVDPVSDPDSGNITYANVTFVNRDNGDIIAADIPVELLDSDIMTGIVSYEWVVDIGSSDSVAFTIGIIVDGYYTRDRAIDNTLVTVSKPIENSVTGGGYLINEYSAGVFAGDADLKTNFGFNVKFNKKLTNLQGHVNIIIRQDDRVYQVKTNAMRSLVADPETNEAIFISKANLIDITDPNNPISVAGNLTLLISLTDRGDSPSSDSIGITLWKRNELWFSSNWTGTETIEQMLAGGNLVIHGHRK